MTDRPIIFSAPMVRALLDGRKTQTRRVLKPQLGSKIASAFEVIPGKWRFIDEDGCRAHQVLKLPYAPGDRLYVRERFAVSGIGWGKKPKDAFGGKVHYFADPDNGWFHYWGNGHPSIHMPRWASRLTLTVTDVRVQRLQEITNADAVAEGIERINDLNGFRDYQSDDPSARVSTRVSFQSLWNSIHGDDAWDANPWVAAISFDVQHGNIDHA